MNVPIGTILAYAGDVYGNAQGSLESQGWLVCDGTEYAESDYPDLQNTIGTYYGTASRAGMFKVPDLQGLFLRGVDGGKGRDPDAASRTSLFYGGNTSDSVGSYQDDEFKSHTHQSTRENVDGRANFQGGQDGWGNTADVTATGGHETRPKNIYVYYIIKAKDVS